MFVLDSCIPIIRDTVRFVPIDKTVGAQQICCVDGMYVAHLRNMRSRGLRVVGLFYSRSHHLFSRPPSLYADGSYRFNIVHALARFNFITLGDMQADKEWWREQGRKFRLRESVHEIERAAGALSLVLSEEQVAYLTSLTA